VNGIIGWTLAAIVLLVYMMTTAPVVAFWDNGEFIAVGYTLGVGHPPGSPMYTLVTRLFSLLPFGNVARAVNFESVLAAALAIAFLYFSLTKMARRWEGKVESFAEALPTYITGITGALLTAFSFSFWENALEAEVYATNILTMTGTLWLVLRWAELGEVPRDRRMLHLVVYVLALGVGTHLGCLLWAPAYLLYVILFESNMVGVLLLSIPLGMGFVLLSKGIARGAVGLWLLWLAVTVFYAVPAFWPKKELPKRKGRPTRVHPASLPTPLSAVLLAVCAVALVTSGVTYGGSGAGWFIFAAGVSLRAVYLFVHLLRKGTIDRPEVPARIVLSIAALAALALSVHAYLLIRARLKPAINESDPKTWQLVLDVMRRKQYEPMRFFPRRTPFANQFHILWTYYNYQFSKAAFAVFPFALALWGAIAHARRDRRTFALMLTVNLIASLGLLLYMNISDHEVRSREYFWVPSYVGLAIWMGIGSGEIVRWAKKIGRAYRAVIAAALVAFSLTPFVTHVRAMDRSDNYVAHYYGWNMINFLDPNSILITNGDNDTFPLWYLQEVEGVRKDVEVVNLSLIQTNWYIEQLKDRGIPMSFSYEEIAQMHPYWVRDPETGEPVLVTLRDIVLNDIIREVGWSRPIYFAVTVEDFMGYYDNLMLEGMVFRLVPTTQKHQIDEERTRQNVYENYRYDSIVDKDDGWRVMTEVYKAGDTARLITNYAAGFSRLGFAAMQDQPPRFQEAIGHYMTALKFAPDYGPGLNGLVAIYAVGLRQPEKALPYADQLIVAQPGEQDSWIRFGGVNLMVAERLDDAGQAERALEHYEKALTGYEHVLDENASRPEIYPPLLAIYQRLGMQEKENQVLDLWQQYAPQDFERMMQYSRETGAGRSGAGPAGAGQ
jgi:tetratricopeptide (TPR) repeat protein